MTNCTPGSRATICGDGIPHHRQQARDLVRPAARQQRHDRSVEDQPDLAQKSVFRLLRACEIHQRMADELYGYAGIAIQLFLERKDHQHAVGDALDHPHAALAPRPQLRTDVVDDRDAELFYGAGEPEIEIRKVNRDQRLRLLVRAASTSRLRTARDLGTTRRASTRPVTLSPR